MRRNNVTKKHYVLAFVGLMLAAPLAAKNHLPSEKVFPKRSNIYKKGWIDLNKNGKKTCTKTRHRRYRSVSTT